MFSLLFIGYCCFAAQTPPSDACYLYAYFVVPPPFLPYNQNVTYTTIANLKHNTHTHTHTHTHSPTERPSVSKHFESLEGNITLSHTGILKSTPPFSRKKRVKPNFGSTHTNFLLWPNLIFSLYP